MIILKYEAAFSVAGRTGEKMPAGKTLLTSGHNLDTEVARKFSI